MIQSCLEKRTNKKYLNHSFVLMPGSIRVIFGKRPTQHMCKDNGKHQDSNRNFMDMCKRSIPLKMEGKEEEEKNCKKKGPSKRMEGTRDP